MSDSVDLRLARFAELVAPAITRAFVSGMRSAGGAGRELIRAYGDPAAVGYLIDLRNPLAAGRPVTRDGLAAVFRYHTPEQIDTTMHRALAADLLAEDDAGLTATARGRQLLDELLALHRSALAGRWGPDGAPPGGARPDHVVERLNEIIQRVVVAAAQTAGAAWAVQAPPYEPAGTPPGVLLLNRLSTLRYHRADAHAAAWQAAGLTAADMVAMPSGDQWTPQRQAVEHDTNVRASVPYVVLTPDERLRLLADLAALP